MEPHPTHSIHVQSAWQLKECAQVFYLCVTFWIVQPFANLLLTLLAFLCATLWELYIKSLSTVSSLGSSYARGIDTDSNWHWCVLRLRHISTSGTIFSVSTHPGVQMTLEHLSWRDSRSQSLVYTQLINHFCDASSKEMPVQSLLDKI